MVLTAQEESLIGVLRRLSPEEAGKVFRWAHELSDLSGGRPIQWADTWNDEDLADATQASLKRFEDSELHDH